LQKHGNDHTGELTLSPLWLSCLQAKNLVFIVFSLEPAGTVQTDLDPSRNHIPSRDLYGNERLCVFRTARRSCWCSYERPLRKDMRLPGMGGARRIIPCGGCPLRVGRIDIRMEKILHDMIEKRNVGTVFAKLMQG
jgi:hypothetical protein